MTSATYNSGLHFGRGSVYKYSVGYAALRCMKDSHAISFIIDWLDLYLDTAVSADLSARVIVNGNKNVEKGFIYGKTKY